MEEVKDVILNVYTLSVPPATDAQNATTSSSSSSSSTNSSSNQQQQRSHSTSSWSSFFVSQMLPSMGLGAYHTSLRVGSNHDSPYTITYTFVANQGIVSSRSRSRNDAQQQQQQLPSHATFKEEIVLGACSCTRGQVQDILQRLSQYYFTKTSYHLVHRNCNHFTETFATALIHYPAFMNYHDSINSGGTITSPRSLVASNFYPDWINRLAHTGAIVVADADIRPCRAPWDEAYHAVTNTKAFLEEDPAGSGGRRWGSVSSKILSGSKSTTIATTKKKPEKKELTEAQKKLLEKIRKK